MLLSAKFILRHTFKIIQINEKNCVRNYRMSTITYCTDKELTLHKKTNDNLLENIKSSTNSLNLLNTIGNLEKPLNPQHAMESLRILFNLQKNDSSLSSSDILKNPEFEKLCKYLRNKLHFLHVNDYIDALKIFSYFGLSANTNIINILLNHLRKRINELQLNQIIFLDFLLRKFNKTPLVDAIQIALQSIFQIQLKQQIDYENISELTNLLEYSIKYDLSQQCITSIISALTLHGTNIKLNNVKIIICSLCNLRNFKPSPKIYEKLLINCFIILNRNFNNYEFNDIDYILKKLTEKYNKYELFYNEEFFNKCASYAVEMDIGLQNCGYFLKKFNKIRFVSIILLDYMINEIIQNPKMFYDQPNGLYISLTAALSNANYIPNNWDKLKSIILSHPILQLDINDLPWIKICTNLLVLECYNEKLINKIFDNKFLEEYLSRGNNYSDYMQMLNLYQAVVILMENYKGNLPNIEILDKAMELNRERISFPLKIILEHIMGDKKFVLTNVTTKYGHVIDHVIIFDEHDKPVKINEADESTDENNQLVFLEDLPSNQKMIAIESYPKSRYVLNFPRLRGIFGLRIKTLEALGLLVIPINIEKWTIMPEKERSIFIEREIKFKFKKINNLVK